MNWGYLRGMVIGLGMTGLLIFSLVMRVQAAVTISSEPDQTSQSPQNVVNYTALQPQGSLQQGTVSPVLSDSTGGLDLNRLAAQSLKVAQTAPATGANNKPIEPEQTSSGMGKLLGWILAGGFIVIAAAGLLYIRQTTRNSSS